MSSPDQHDMQAADLRSTKPTVDADPSDALARLDDWHSDRTDLSFLYARSKGGLMHVGRGRIVARDDAVLRVDTTSGSMTVVIASAKFTTEPQLFFAPDFSASYHVAGVSIFLENFDWLFFSGEASPERLGSASGHRALC